MADLYALTKDAMDRVSKAVLAHERRPGANDTRHRGRYPIGVGGSCPDRNEIHDITIGGSPTAGSLTFDLDVNGTSEEIELAFDDTASEVKTAFEGHSEIATDDVTVTGGPLPDVSIRVEFVANLAGTAILPPTSVDHSGLTGGTGTVAMIYRQQPGYPNE